MQDTTNEKIEEAPKWKGILQLAIIVLVVAVAIFFARAPSREFLELDSGGGLTRIEPTAAVIQPQPTAAAHSVSLTGTVNTLGSVAVIPQAAGEVVYVAENFRTGGEFSADETLVQIDTAKFDLRLANARLDLAVAEANLREVRDKQSRGNLSLARNQAGSIDLYLDLDGELERAEARVQLMRNKIALAEIALDETRVRMPFDGHVRVTTISVGQVVNPQMRQIGEVYAKNELRVVVPISMFDIDSLQPVAGRAASVIVNGRAYRTVVERVSKQVENQTRLAMLFLLILDQENTETLPLPGSFANVIIEGPQRENVFVLPEASMQINNSVWLVDDGALVSFTPESLGFTDEGWLVTAFDIMDGVVVGSVSGAREGLDVIPIAAQNR